MPTTLPGSPANQYKPVDDHATCEARSEAEHLFELVFGGGEADVLAVKR